MAIKTVRHKVNRRTRAEIKKFIINSDRSRKGAGLEPHGIKDLAGKIKARKITPHRPSDYLIKNVREEIHRDRNKRKNRNQPKSLKNKEDQKNIPAEVINPPSCIDLTNKSLPTTIKFNGLKITIESLDEVSSPSQKNIIDLSSDWKPLEKEIFKALKEQSTVQSTDFLLQFNNLEDGEPSYLSLAKSKIRETLTDLENRGFLISRKEEGPFKPKIYKLANNFKIQNES